jgi:hypothetical protein
MKSMIFTYLTSNLSNTMTSIGNIHAADVRLQKVDNLMKCTSLSRIVIPSSVEIITLCGFSTCSALSEVDFPSDSHLKRFDGFQNCTSLGRIVIPSSVEVITQSGLLNCSSGFCIRQGVSRFERVIIVRIPLARALLCSESDGIAVPDSVQLCTVRFWTNQYIESNLIAAVAVAVEFVAAARPQHFEPLSAEFFNEQGKLGNESCLSVPESPDVHPQLPTRPTSDATPATSACALSCQPSFASRATNCCCALLRATAKRPYFRRQPPRIERALPT